MLLVVAALRSLSPTVAAQERAGAFRIAAVAEGVAMAAAVFGFVGR